MMVLDIRRVNNIDIELSYDSIVIIIPNKVLTFMLNDRYTYVCVCIIKPHKRSKIIVLNSFHIRN